VSLATLMSSTTKEPATMWGTSIVGFGSYHYKYESGREGASCLVGFASRKSERRSNDPAGSAPSLI
jgi:hypothetical protein